MIGNMGIIVVEVVGLLWKMAKGQLSKTVTTNIIIIEVTFKLKGVAAGQDLLPNIAVQSLDLRLLPRHYLVVPPPADAH